ncbi:MAG: glycine/betaine ABC transporter substrate-binding protein [Comamonadaceae bacterium]|nr:MAG: glycine/betaine ABC transporter substrate-binding protein [Comamonadaceae bacterium]
MNPIERRAIIQAGPAAVIAAATGTRGAFAQTPPQARPLVIGQISLSFHVASAGVVRQVLQRDSVAHTVVEAPHEKIYEMLGTGEIDMAISAWLPGSHGAFIQPYEADLMKLGVLYEPYTIWGVPDYVPQAELESVADLLKPQVSARMTKVIQGIGPGAGISRFSREIMAAYQLDAAGYEFRNGSLDDCVNAFEQAVTQRRWVVVPLWHPQYLHNTHVIRALAEPRGLLRGKDAATLVLRKSAAGLLPARTLATLQKMHLGNAAVAELDDLVSRKKMDPLDAARDWSGRHAAVVSAWG